MPRLKSEHEASGKATSEASVLFESVLEDQLAQLKRGYGVGRNRGMYGSSQSNNVSFKDVELPNI